MSSSLDRAVKDFVQILQESKEKGTSPYDTTATVTRVEDSIAWVHIPGGVEETPVQMTMNVNAGDTVQVRVSGGKAWIAGNATSPPTDDTVAKEAGYKALMAEEVAKIAGEKAENSEATAKRALKIADDTDQYFWHMESGTDTGTHITEIPHDEFIARTAEDPTDGGPNLLARSGGMAVRIGLEELAQFSDYIGLGKDNESHAFINYHSLQLIDKEGEIYFHVSDLRDKDGRYSEYFVGNGSRTQFKLGISMYSIYKISIDDVETSDYTYNAQTDTITFNTPPDSGSKIVITGTIYSGDPFIYKAYTLGIREPWVDDLTAIGALSFAEGYGVVASGIYTHAEGGFTSAHGSMSHAEGAHTKAYGYASHAEGDGTVAGSSNSDSYWAGEGAHAEGVGSQALAMYSHAQNYYTVAKYNAQTVIGKHNDNQSDTAFEIGNGTSKSARSNAFTIDWKGRVTLYKEGAIAYKGTKRTGDIIKFYDNTADEWGNGIGIGDGGLVLIGAGEYVDSRWGVGDLIAGAENLYLGADGNVRIEAAGNTIANRKTWVFGDNGVLITPGSIYSDWSNIDLSKSNNAVSSTQYPTSFCLRDKSDRTMTRIEGIIASSGTVGANWYVRNYDSSGASVAQKGIAFTMDKSGNLTYSISDPAKFRSAIGVGTIGTKNSLADSDIPAEILRKSELTAQTFKKENVSINANNYISGQTLDVTKSGYTAIGLLGVWCTGTNVSFAMPYQTYLDGNTVKFNIRNFATAAASLTFYARVLYKES